MRFETNQICHSQPVDDVDVASAFEASVEQTSLETLGLQHTPREKLESFLRRSSKIYEVHAHSLLVATTLFAIDLKVGRAWPRLNTDW